MDKISKWFSDFLDLIPAWEYDKDFSKIYKSIANRRGNHITRCFMLFQYLRQTENLDGEIAEVGVFWGKTGKLLALSTSKHVHLFDTFEGMPQHDPDKDPPRWKKGYLKSDLVDVKTFLSDCNNVTIYPGFFPDTSNPIRDKKFSFVHIDVDIYQSVKDCSEFFYPRMVRSGILVYDDPGFISCKGAKIAVDEFYADKPEKPIYILTGQAIVIKW